MGSEARLGTNGEERECFRVADLPRTEVSQEPYLCAELCR